MKNVTMTINPNAITSLAPPMPVGYPGNPTPVPSKTISVSFSAQFDDEARAMDFASYMLNHMRQFNVGDD